MGLDLRTNEIMELEDPVVIVENVKDDDNKSRKGWMAHVTFQTDPDSPYDNLERDFVKPSRQKKDDNGNGARMYHLDEVEPGFYEVNSNITEETVGRRLYFLVENGEIAKCWDDKQEFITELKEYDELGFLYSEKIRLLGKIAEIITRIKKLESEEAN
jgi:hypothetical protein